MQFQRTCHSIALFCFLLSFPAVAADTPLKLSATFDLSRGNTKGTFFELMSGQNGIKASLDEDYENPVSIVSPNVLLEKSGNFDHIKELESKIKGGESGLVKLVENLAGKQIPVSKMYGYVMGAMKSQDLFLSSDGRQQSRLAGALIPILALSSGKGVLVRLDGENYCYNFGYAKGSGGSDIEQDKQDRKSGRSYGASIERNAYDPSDNDYLRELALYTANADTRELKNFYTTIFEILLQSDTSGIRDLTKEGQTVVADFMAIYMAELDRHLMTGLKMYEWENALAEITMLAAYSASNEGITLDPRGGASNDNERGLVASKELKEKDRLLGFFGVGTDGSGLDGRNKQRRHGITRQVSKEQRNINEALVAKIEKMIGAKAGADIYDDAMEFINNYKTQDSVKRNADELVKALVDFVLATRNYAGKISVE